MKDLGKVSKKNRIIRKADVILLICLVIVGLLSAWLSLKGDSGSKVYAYVDGKLYGTYSLSVDREVTIKNGSHVNKFIIKDGSVQMSYSTCKNQICVDTGKVSKTNSMIVCLPNKVGLEIKGGDSDVDVLSN